jgi:hypothetical protein
MNGDDAGSIAAGKPTGAYRRFLPDLNTPRFQTMKAQDAHEYAHDFIVTKNEPPWIYALYRHWRTLFEQPFKGVTSDGMYDVWYG